MSNDPKTNHFCKIIFYFFFCIIWTWGINTTWHVIWDDMWAYSYHKVPGSVLGVLTVLTYQNKFAIRSYYEIFTGFLPVSFSSVVVVVCHFLSSNENKDSRKINVATHSWIGRKCSWSLCTGLRVHGHHRSISRVGQVRVMLSWGSVREKLFSSTLFCPLLHEAFYGKPMKDDDAVALLKHVFESGAS